MRFAILLMAVVIASCACAAPHQDGAHTHAPVVAPDAESVMSGKGREHSEQSMQAMHHSDVHLGGKFTNDTALAEAVVSPSEGPGTDLHHSDAYMMGTVKTDHATTVDEDGEGVTVTRTINQEFDGVTRSVIQTKSSDMKGNAGSVVAHGPMAKNVEHHDKSHSQEHHHKSTVHHAPIAHGHQPHKNSNVQHPPLSHAEPASAVAHFPMIHHEEGKSEKRSEETVPMSSSPVKHAPMATEHHTPKLAHHPSLSKSEQISSDGSHAPFAIPKPGGEDKEIHVEKKSLANKAEHTTTQPADLPKQSNAHHPFLSKTEPAAPLSKSPEPIIIQKSAKILHGTSTTEINANFLDNRQIIPGSHPLAISPLTRPPP